MRSGRLNNIFESRFAVCAPLFESSFAQVRGLFHRRDRGGIGNFRCRG